MRKIKNEKIAKKDDFCIMDILSMSHHVFFLDPQDGRNDSTFIVPPDASTTIDENQRLTIIKNINLCENHGQFLDTGIIDQLLSVLSSERIFLCPSYSTIKGQMQLYW